MVVQEAFGARVGADFLTGFATNPMGMIAALSVATLFPAVESFIGINRFVEKKIVTDVTRRGQRPAATARATAYAYGGPALSSCCCWWCCSASSSPARWPGRSPG